MNKSFLPVSQKDLAERGWKECDVILISGDAYVDHPSYGTAVIGRVLEHAGYRVGIISQPDWREKKDFLKLGKPRLFFGISSGNLDSMVANYTANKRPRQKDEYSPAGKTGLRPDRALIVYSNRIREIFGGVPVVLGGVEASLRRFAHYDYWDNAVRRSVMVDARADVLVYGMGEKAVLEIAKHFAGGGTPGNMKQIRGTVMLKKEIDKINEGVLLPSFEEAGRDHKKFNEALRLIFENQSPRSGKQLFQPHQNRFVVQFPPQLPLIGAELDGIYELPYSREIHPSWVREGIPGFESVKLSLVSHRGCPGGCSFCGLSLHQGRIVQSRSIPSLVREAELLSRKKYFRGTITDLGGPTVNLYAAFCGQWKEGEACGKKMCLYPEVCSGLRIDYRRNMELLRRIGSIPGVKHLFLGSGFRYDLLLESGSRDYFREVSSKHISGTMKVAPEHFSAKALALMRKPGFKKYEVFCAEFRKMKAVTGRENYLVSYFISAPPGAALKDALEFSLWLLKSRIHPEQIQDFIPLPMTLAGAQYYTGEDPFTGEEIYTAKSFRERKMHRALLQYRNPSSRKWIKEALAELGAAHLFRLYRS